MCFTESTHLREESIIAIGPPLSSRQYLESYQLDKAATINQLTDDTYQLMKEYMIEVPPEREIVFDNVGRMWRSTLHLPFWPVESNDPERFNNERIIAQFISSLDSEKLEKINVASQKWVNSYRKVKIGFNPFIGIPGILGLIVNYIPVRLGKWFADTVIESPEFYATIRMVASLVAFIVYYAGLLAVTYFNPELFWLPIAFILLGISYLYHLHRRDEKRKMNLNENMIQERDMLLSSIFEKSSKQPIKHE